MMIFRFSCAALARHVASNVAKRQNLSPTAFVFILFVTPPRLDVIGRKRSQGLPHFLTTRYSPANRPINNSKNFAESTSTATLALGTNFSRRTGDVFTLAKVGADPRIA